MINITCYADGGYNNIKKTNGYGSFRIYDSTSDTTIRNQFPDIKSSNEAEYLTLITLLEYLLENYPEEVSVTIFMDSKIVVNQVGGIWEVRKPTLIPFYETAIILINRFEDIKLNWVSRKVIVGKLGH